MTLERFLALLGFAFVTSITPGPNNLMLMVSGASFGLRRTLPHMLGVALGFVFMTVLVGLGMERAFREVPLLSAVLKAASVIYLLYLAWKIAVAPPPGEAAGVNKPMSFMAAAGFQWINPKAWGMALTAVSAYAPSGSLDGVFTVALAFGIVNLPSVGCWAVLGQQMSRTLADPRRSRAFNIAMAVLLVLTLYPVLHD